MPTTPILHHEDFEAARGAMVVRDPSARVREVQHRQPPFQAGPATRGQTPQATAQAYLQTHGDLLAVAPDEIKNLSLAAEPEPVDAGVEYRLLEEKSFFDLTTIAYHQTVFGLPVRGAGIAVHIKQNPLRVVSATSTAHPDVAPRKPNPRIIRKFRKLSAQGLSGIMKLSGGDPRKDHANGKLRVNRTRLMVYRYDAEARLPEPGDPKAGRREVFPHAHPTLPLPAVADGLEDGGHTVVAEVLFTLDVGPWGRLNWVVLIDVETASVLYLRALVDNVNGQVFAADPMTATGNAANGPTANNATLNPLRTSVTLQGLNGPVGGMQSLTGAFVQVTDHEAPVVNPPTRPAGSDFNFNVRTDNFTAVNTYYHVDGFFRLIQDMGFTVANYFDGTTFPVQVDHRGRFLTADEIEINASCGGNAMSNGIGLPDFELADLTDTANPLGIACDWRVVLHEFGGHGILWDHVGSANLGFAHSAGDSFATILNDPDSQAPDRFQSFPWLAARRHDRAVASGWAWGGANDTGSYNSEQILCTSNFRVYRSIGGDSTWAPTRRFAARYMAYLMLRAVATLTSATNPTNASGFASALLTADLVDWTSEGHAGGAYSKVIRWAFEKQGLYQPAGAPTPVTGEGAPPDVDVYVDDGRAGEYQYLGNHWSCPNIWNRLMPDGGTVHQRPVVGVPNYAYVKIKNRGTQNATGVVVKGFHCQPASGLTWPNDWQAMTTAQLNAPDVAPNHSAEVTVGPFEWVPSQPDHECMLMIVSAAGDPSNIDNFTAGDTIPEWRLVPHDNNIGQRNVSPVPGGGGGGGLFADFDPKRFTVRNPHRGKAVIEIVPVLPKLLLSRGWEVRFDNPGGRAFTLAPGQAREVVMRLQPGADFSPADVKASSERSIHVETYGDGILLGGMTYELDPEMTKAPAQYPSEGEDDCANSAKKLLDCLGYPMGRVKRARVRKITVDIDIADEDC